MRWVGGLCRAYVWRRIEFAVASLDYCWTEVVAHEAATDVDSSILLSEVGAQGRIHLK